MRDLLIPTLQVSIAEMQSLESSFIMKLLFGDITASTSFFSDNAESKMPPPLLMEDKFEDKHEGESDEDAGEASIGETLDFPSAAAWDLQEVICSCEMTLV